MKPRDLDERKERERRSLCPTPHPQRDADGLTFHPDLVVIASVGGDAWLRCRRCGRWLWLATDVGGKLEFVAGKELDGALACRAFVDGEVDALAALCVRYDIPYGPVWESATALANALSELAGHPPPARLRSALAATAPKGRWGQALAALDDRVATPAVPPLAFSVAAPIPACDYDSADEVGGALVLLRSAPPGLVRVERHGVVELPLAAAPRRLATSADRLLIAVAVDGGESLLVVDGAGQVTAWPASPGRHDAHALDDGWWLVWSDAWGEFHLPDGRARAKVRLGSFAAPPRRMGDGWLVTDAVDDAGHSQALTLFDTEFRMLACSDGVRGARTLLPVDSEVAWCGPVGGEVLERWQRDGRRLERTTSVRVRASARAGDTIVAILPDGKLAGWTLDGVPRWAVRTSAMYLVAIGERIVAYHHTRADVLDARDGRAIRSFTVEGPDVAVAGAALFMRSDAQLVVVPAHGAIVRTLVDERARLIGAAGAVALLADERPRCTFVDAGGTILGYVDAPASSVIMGRNAIYVRDRERVHIR